MLDNASRDLSAIAEFHVRTHADVNMFSNFTDHACAASQSHCIASIFSLTLNILV